MKPDIKEIYKCAKQCHSSKCFCLEKCVCESLSHVQLFATPWTVALQAPLSVEFFGQEDWSGLPFPPLGDLPDPGFKPASPVSPALQVDSLPAEPSEKPLHLTFVL